MTDTKHGLPVIISVDDSSHWILVLRAGQRTVQILDPEDDTPVQITRKELIKRWKYEEKDKLIFQGISLEPFRDKSIKAVKIREQLLATIDVR